MPTRKDKHAEIIQTLKTGSFYFECPNTSEDVSLEKAPLFANDD